MNHDQLCLLAHPCRSKLPEHGVMTDTRQPYCIHCEASCECAMIRRIREHELAHMRDEVLAIHDFYELLGVRPSRIALARMFELRKETLCH